ncbi:MAG: hypothetical protein JNL98_35015, partial [Bryobacterales bacterium]|nr:hypothetical protein [Bryobacterales bacterium]
MSGFQFQTGLVSSFEQRQLPGPVVKTQQQYTWTQDPQGRPYIGAVVSTMDPGTAYAKQSKMEQTLDVYGNVTQTKQYAFGNLVTPARTNNNTYLTTGNYPTYHLNNRLVTSTTSDGNYTIVLASNTYDTGTVYDTPTTPGRWNASHAGPAGRLTSSVTPGARRNYQYDKTGNVVSADDGYGHSVSVTPSQAADYARPGQIRPNNNANLAETLTWSTAFFGLTQDSAPNGATSSIAYDSAARP